MRGRPSTIILPEVNGVALEAADQIVAIAEQVLKNQDTFRVVLSGGSTPKRLYEILATDPYRSRLPWNHIHLFWGDERCVSPGHPDSNYRMASEALLNKVNIPAANVHRMQGESSDLENEARKYEQTLWEHFGLGPDSPPPRFDLVLLGMGTDGHTASLFPGTAALRETDRWVVANSVPKLGTTRLTLTPVILNQARWVILLVVGSDKAKTLAEVREGPFDPEKLPSQLIRPVDGDILWLLDKAASACLQTSTYTYVHKSQCLL